jgi:DNA mismatch endonuclease (patch repair protein)
MVANSGRESALELSLRQELFARGLRFRKHLRVLPGLRCTPDIAFTRRRVAVFVDGCFWHRCPVHGTDPVASADWWRRKLDANVERDRRNDAALTAAGWTVLRFWEHTSVAEMADGVQRALNSRIQPRR